MIIMNLYGLKSFSQLFIGILLTLSALTSCCIAVSGCMTWSCTNMPRSSCNGVSGLWPIVVRASWLRTYTPSKRTNLWIERFKITFMDIKHISVWILIHKSNRQVLFVLAIFTELIFSSNRLDVQHMSCVSLHKSNKIHCCLLCSIFLASSIESIIPQRNTCIVISRTYWDLHTQSLKVKLMQCMVCWIVDACAISACVDCVPIYREYSIKCHHVDCDLSIELGMSYCKLCILYKYIWRKQNINLW